MARLISAYFFNILKNYSFWMLSFAGGLDYANTSDFVVISSAPFLNCTMILIEDDSVAENTELFFVMLGSTDDAVIIGTNLATVVILDISGRYISIDFRWTRV